MKCAPSFQSMRMLLLAAALGLSAIGAMAKTFVYVSDSRDGTIDGFELDLSTGAMLAIGKIDVGKSVAPMAISPDRRHLYAAVRSQPYTVFSFDIDPRSGRLSKAAAAPLPDNMLYASTDLTGRFLFTASYGGDKLAVSAIGPTGLVKDDSIQTITGFQEVQNVDVTAHVPQGPFLSVLASMGSGVATHFNGAPQMRLVNKDAALGSSIQRPVSLTATGQALAILGVSGLIANSQVLFSSDGITVPMADVMRRLGASTVQDVLSALNIARDAVVYLTVTPQGRTLTVTFVSSVALGKWADSKWDISGSMAEGAFRIFNYDTNRQVAALSAGAAPQSAAAPATAAGAVSGANSATQAVTKESDAKRDSQTWYHYTDQAGFEASMVGGGTLIANNGRVYASPVPMSADDANTTLFIGGPPGFENKGQYVIAFKFNDPAMTMIPSVKPGEFFYPGTLRNGRQITITSAGPNPF